MKFSKQAALVAAVGLIATLAGCGARVSPYLGAATAAGSSSATTLGNNGVSTGSSGSTSQTTLSGAGGSTSPGGATGTTVPGGSTSPGQIAIVEQGLAPANFNYNPQDEAAYCTGTAGNTSSAPGVTPTSITVGNVSGLTGLIPDSFSPGPQAVIAAFNAVNRFGGICGRQLKVNVQNDQQSASVNESATTYLIPQVLAFVGSVSDADNGGVDAMVAANTPDMGPAINTNRSNSSVYWSATGGSVTVRGGRAYLYNTWINGLKAYHDLPSSIAVLSYSIAISAQAGEEFATAFKDAGVKICYSNYGIEAGAQGGEMGGIVQSMANAHCGGVYTTMDVVGNADMLQAMGTQSSWHPSLVSTTYEGYTPDQISAAGESNAQGLQVALNSVPLTDSNAGVQLYQSELGTYEPGDATSEFGLEAWDDAQMFIYALLKAGRNPTRASLTSALSQITNWTSDGAVGPYTPRDRTGPVCTDDVIVRGDGFDRDWPSAGMYCNGQLIDVGPAS